MAANDSAIDHVPPVVGRSEIEHRDERRALDALLSPMPEADIDRIPFTVALALALAHASPRAAVT
nr:hypothetical protein [Gluconobacter wancherniae]